MDWFVSVFYGFLTGLGELMPVSAGTHDYFLELMTRFDPNQPLLRLWIHLAILLAVLLLNRHRVAHIYREMRIAAQPARRRKRQPDVTAVLDGRVVITALLPAATGLVLMLWLRSREQALPMIALLLILNGMAIYAPHFLPGANRDSRHLSQLEAWIFGIAAGLSAFTGVSRMGAMISAGAFGGCARGYVLEIFYLMMLPLLALLVILDLFAVLAGGIGAITFLVFLKCLLSGAAAFGGACLAITVMRFLSVNAGYTAFAYYNWGLGFFAFVLYLMI
jgi:undecaprenyl pyrophosphate phosphatase UppP